MKVIQINITCGVSSTGKICASIAQLLKQNEIESRVFYSSSHGVDAEKQYGVQYSNTVYTKLHALKSRVFGNYGFNAKYVTKKLIKLIEVENPDIVHLHNLHAHNCDLQMLFSYFQKKQLRLVWTFHDCWAFTGYCPYFSACGCEKWETGCEKCPLFKSYSWFFDRSSWLYEKKKSAFANLDLTIVTPSQWLADLVKRSFLGNYDVRVINNGIDLDLFKPTYGSFKKQYGIENKFTILGVCFNWCYNKGLDAFVQLADKLSDDYAIVLVGTDENVEKILPKRIISINRTTDQKQLAEIYTSCDVFVNPTREDNFPTVNIEALACGTPVVTFDTGGSPEIIDSTCGMVVKADTDDLISAIEYIKNEKPFTKEACLKRASRFNDKERFSEYLGLYLGNEK